MLSPLMMKMPAATTTPTSGYSRCHDGTADQGPDTTVKDQGVGLVRLANASALFPPLAHFACPSCPSCRDIIGAALCRRSGPQVRVWGEMQAHLNGRLGPRVRCLCRWPAKIWGDFSLCKSCCRLGDYRGHRPTTSLCATSLALHRHTTRFGKSRAASPSSQHSSTSLPHLK